MKNKSKKQEKKVDKSDEKLLLSDVKKSCHDKRCRIYKRVKYDANTCIRCDNYF